MFWWLIGILGYLVALGVVLLLAGGVRRADRLREQALHELPGVPEPEALVETDPRDALMRPSAPLRSVPRMRSGRRALSS